MPTPNRAKPTARAAAKKTVAKKPLAKKTVAKQPVAKQPVAKQPVAKKTTHATPVGWREATRGDRRHVVDMSLALFAEDPGTYPLTARDVGRTLSRLEAEPVRGRAVVAEAEVAGRTVVVGYAFLCSFWSNELRGEVCTVDELYIRPIARSLGLGSGLVQSLVQRRTFFEDAVAFELEVSGRNTRARALYERLGFVPRKNASLRLLRP
jgi:ribosomal protein S18 acetylase RimI-like enzyme